MYRQNLVPRSGIEHVLRPGHHGAETTPGVTLALLTNRSLATVIARKDDFDDLAQRVRAAFEFELPTLPRRVGAGSIECAWAGPGQWLFIGKDSGAPSFEAMTEKLKSLAAVSDQSDGRIVISVSGPQMRSMLAKGVPIDLHPRSFKPGDVAMTAVAHIAVHLSLIDDTPSCELVVFRSYAASLWKWLLDAGAEFGVEVVESA